jgi:hypothetical protein
MIESTRLRAPAEPPKQRLCRELIGSGLLRYSVS